MSTLDCGHPASPTEISGGIAHTHDGRRICPGCADEDERANLRVSRSVVAYLSVPLPGSVHYRITTWSGGDLMLVERMAVRKLRGFGRSTYDRVYIHATDTHGNRWVGTGMGPGMFVRMRRARGRADRPQSCNAYFWATHANGWLVVGGPGSALERLTKATDLKIVARMAAYPPTDAPTPRELNHEYRRFS